MGNLRSLLAGAASLVLGVVSASGLQAADPDIRIVAKLGGSEGRQIELRDGDIIRSGTKFRLVVSGDQSQSVSGHFTNPEGLIRPLSTTTMSLSAGTVVLPTRTSWYQIERDSDGLVSFDLNFGNAGDAELTASTSLYFIAGSSSAYGISKLPDVRGIQTLKPKPAFFPQQILNAKARATAGHAYFTQLGEAGLAGDPLATRGSSEISVFKQAAPGVVLVITEDGLGSGSLLSEDGLILTNHHVIAGNSEIGVVFKPQSGLDVGLSDVVTAQLEKLDQVADLALLRVQDTPDNARVLELATLADAEVGLDVHAIGHPDAELWTYTRGYISQMRGQYEWLEHVADVIQTQTPINPGNSGGPLLTDDAKIIGVNSFGSGDPTYQGINFAVSVTEIERFLKAPDDRYIEGSEPEDPMEVLQPSYVMIDTDGNGVDDVAAIDYDGNGILDTYVYDEDEDGVMDFILVDRNENGTPDGRMVSRQVGGFGIDVWEFDEDEDGSIDVIGIDYDQDGEIDRYREA